jgi:hypothetical protein
MKTRPATELRYRLRYSVEDVGSDTCKWENKDYTPIVNIDHNNLATEMSLLSLSVPNILTDVPVDSYGVNISYIHGPMNIANDVTVTVATDGPENSLHAKPFVEFILSGAQVRQLCSYLKRISQDM